ncbi:MAG: putative RDD family membrane protein YckC [Myxococcota bacterium]
MLLDTTATIETPERVRFQHRLAGPGPRAAAWLIDASVQLIVLSAVGAVLALVFSLTGLEGVGAGLWLVVLFVVEWFYGVFFETLLAGRTPGKLVLSLRTVRLDGSPGQFPDFLLRNLLRAADFLPVGFGLGVLCMVLDPRMRRLGDMVAGTVVIIEERTRVLGEVRIDPPVSEEERQALPARVDLTRAELDVIEALLRRRRSLSDARAEELAWLLGPQLSEATGIEAPSWERVLTLAYARATGKDRA